MKNLFTASLLLIILMVLNNQAFARTLRCNFKFDKIKDIQTIQINQHHLLLNKDMEIPLEKSTVKCGNFGRQTRLDGEALGYQIVVKSCSSEAQLEGHLIDNVNQQAAEIICN